MKAYDENDIQLVLNSLNLLTAHGIAEAKALGGAAQILEMNFKHVNLEKTEIANAVEEGGNK